MRRPASDPRLAAYRILKEVEAGAFADRAAAAHLGGLSPRDRSFARELAYGCVRLRARLDGELARLADCPLSRLERPVLLWLRLGLYQIRELRVPDHAAVHRSVGGARRCAGPGAGRFVNAVLRAALRGEAGAEVFPPLEDDPVGHLTTYGSHPEWLVRRWLERWPVTRVARLVELDNRPPPLTLRLLEEESCASAARKLAGTKARLEPLGPWPRSCRLVAGDPGEVLRCVSAVVQDPAASAVVEYAGGALRGPVLDVCAAPGGKSVAAAWQAPEARPYVAGDLSRERLARARVAAQRVGVELLFAVMDGRRPPMKGATTVLLDVPCTGTGTLRRRPDLRWRAAPERLVELVVLQRELLNAAARLVPPGGRLVYSTCSVEPEENERQIMEFLNRHTGFVRESPGVPDLPAGLLTAEGDLRILPWQHETDGGYAARLRRESDPR